MQNSGVPGNGALSGAEKIFGTLEDLYYQSHYLLTKNNITLEDARNLSGYVAQVRMLLGELERVEGTLQRSGKAAVSIPVLKQRYGELEGMVKETRNRLDREQAGLA